MTQTSFDAISSAIAQRVAVVEAQHLQVIGERREKPRSESIMTRIEDTTYRVLRQNQ